MHKGPRLTAIECKGRRARVAERLERERAEDVQMRLTRANELGHLEREGQEIERSILVLSTDIAAARWERYAQAIAGSSDPPDKPSPAPARDRQIAIDQWRDDVRRQREAAKERSPDPAKDKDRDGPDREQ